MAKVSQNSEFLHDCSAASQRATISGISGAFVEFSWDFRGSESLRSKQLLTLGRFSGVFVLFLLHIASTSLLCIEHCTIQTATTMWAQAKSSKNVSA